MADPAPAPVPLGGLANRTLIKADKDDHKSRDWILIIIPAVLVIMIGVGLQQGSFLLLSLAVGSIGGLVHDLIQNKGLLAYPKQSEEGVYLGALLGALLGGVSGFIGFATTTPPTPLDARSLAVPLSWGIGLKGLIEGGANATAGHVIAK